VEDTKPTVTPEFVIESYNDGRLKDPSNYPTTQPRKTHNKGGPRGVRSQPSTGVRKRRGRGGARVASLRSKPHPKPPGESKKWSGALNVLVKSELGRRFWILDLQSTSGVAGTRRRRVMRRFGRGWRVRYVPWCSPQVFGWANTCSQWPSSSAPSWEIYCVRHWSRFEDYFSNLRGPV